MSQKRIENMSMKINLLEKMSLLKLVQAQTLFAKDNPNILAATQFLGPLLRNPFTQVVISFAVGYFATIKIQQIFGLIRKLSDKKRSEFGNTKQLDSVGGDSKDGLSSERPIIRLTKLQLRDYSGLDENEPIYTSLNGQIYDLSSSRESISQGKLYSWLAGSNANEVIHVACDVMGFCSCNTIQRWEQSLNAEFNVVGYLIDSETPESDAETHVDDDKAAMNRI